MPITYRYDKDTNIVQTRANGLVSTRDMLNYVTSVIEDVRIKEGFVEIIDFQNVRDLMVSYSELTPFLDAWQDYVRMGCRAVVIYAPNDLGFGTFRMLKSFLVITDEAAEDLFMVVRSKEGLDQTLSKLQISPPVA